ncbi:MAG: ABC transporter ATP-binding protein [Dehalococcoidia bacterium]|nr:ABC transporter ATP-binding protein [Dehalococcoidia bacterium]
MIEQRETPPAATRADEPVIRLDNASRWFGNIVAVSDVSFSIGPGIVGLLGPNGAGKSTILQMIAGFLKPSSGSASVRGRSPWRNEQLFRYTGLVPEREAIYPFLTGYEFVLLNARLHRLPDPAAATARAVRTVEMEDAQHRATGGYSKGMKQRIKLASALVHEPSLLLLDEPFNGVDPAQRLRMMSILRGLAATGCTIVFSSHILEEVERLADNVLVIVSGRLAASGDFHRIRRLMTDRPHTFVIRSSDNRRLAAALVEMQWVRGIELVDGGLSVRVSDFGAFTLRIPVVARESGVTLYELVPADQSLESVFSYLVNR